MRVLPRVAVVYDHGSASPVEVIRAARGSCRAWLVYDRAHTDADTAQQLTELGCGSDVTGCAPQQAAARINEHGADGIVTFSEYQISRTAELAQLMGLQFHDQETARRLVDKVAQRQALA